MILQLELGPGLCACGYQSICSQTAHSGSPVSWKEKFRPMLQELQNRLVCIPCGGISLTFLFLVKARETVLTHFLLLKFLNRCCTLFTCLWFWLIFFLPFFWKGNGSRSGSWEGSASVGNAGPVPSASSGKYFLPLFCGERFLILGCFYLSAQAMCPESWADLPIIVTPGPLNDMAPLNTRGMETIEWEPLITFREENESIHF